MGRQQTGELACVSELLASAASMQCIATRIDPESRRSPVPHVSTCMRSRAARPFTTGAAGGSMHACMHARAIEPREPSAQGTTHSHME